MRVLAEVDDCIILETPELDTDEVTLAYNNVTLYLPKDRIVETFKDLRRRGYKGFAVRKSDLKPNSTIPITILLIADAPCDFPAIALLQKHGDTILRVGPFEEYWYLTSGGKVYLLGRIMH